VLTQRDALYPAEHSRALALGTRTVDVGAEPAMSFARLHGVD